MNGRNNHLTHSYLISRLSLLNTVSTLSATKIVCNVKLKLGTTKRKQKKNNKLNNIGY